MFVTTFFPFAVIWDQYEAQSVPATLAGGPLGSGTQASFLFRFLFARCSWYTLFSFLEVYRIQEIEFHVGDNDNTGIKHSGSEHVINDLR